MRSLVARLLFSSAIGVIGTSAFEWWIQFLFPEIYPWKSSIVTIIILILVTSLIAFIVIQEYGKLHQQTAQEIAKRKRLEVLISHLSQESEELIKDKTS